MFNEWPLGELPKELQRTELSKLSDSGYKWNKPHEIVEIFENKVAKFSGSKYGVAIDCCSNGLFLALKYINQPQKIKIPKHTYISVPQQIIHAGYEFEFIDKTWSGIYQLEPLNIWDGAGRWRENMYSNKNTLHVLSFQIKKRIPIGKGGMILCDKIEEYEWFKSMVYDGRNLNNSYADDNIAMMGYHMYMTPEDAARGILLMDIINGSYSDSHNSSNYPDLNKYKVFHN